MIRKMHMFWNTNFEHQHDALKVLQTEIEILLADTYNRFKTSELFKLAMYKRSAQSPTVPNDDEQSW